MKKIVRTVWICLLSGLAFLSVFWAKSEKKQVERQKQQLDSLQIENQRLDSMIDVKEKDLSYLINEKKLSLVQKIDSVNRRIIAMKRAMHVCLYGSPEYMEATRERRRRENEKWLKEIKRMEAQVKGYEQQMEALNK